MAALLGKEAALWLPSGTMANQVALRVLTRPGDDVIVSRESHAGWHETGGAAANAGVQFTEIGARGVFTREEFLARGDRAATPCTRRRRWSRSRTRTTARAASSFRRPRSSGSAPRRGEHGIATYLDGARLWNAAVASRRPLAELAAPFDLVGVALLEGPRRAGRLGPRRARATSSSERSDTAGCSAARCGRSASSPPPASTRSTTTSSGWPRTTRTRGGSRSGSRRARGSSSTSARCRRTSSSSVWPTTRPMRPALVARARERGVLDLRHRARVIRAVTHLDVSRKQCDEGAEILAAIAES